MRPRRAAGGQARRIVTGVRPDQWSNRSWCAAWDARGVVGHVVAMHGHMLRPLGRQLSAAPSAQDDPLRAFRAARADVESVLDDPQLASTECDTPTGRDLPGCECRSCTRSKGNASWTR